MRNHFQLNFDGPRSRIYYFFFQDLFFNDLNRETIVIEQKYKNHWHKNWQKIEFFFVSYTKPNFHVFPAYFTAFWSYMTVLNPCKGLE